MRNHAVMLREFTTRGEAELACGLLASQGIKAWLIDNSVLGSGWLSPGRCGGICLQVDTECADEAQQILAAAEQAYEPHIPADVANQMDQSCPACGSAHKIFEPRRLLTTLLAHLFRGNPNPFRVLAEDRWRCSECYHRWPARS